MLTIEERTKLHQRGADGFVKDGVVDWENIEELRLDAKEGTYCEEFYNGILDNLVNRKVLSLNIDGNVMLADISGLNLNPAHYRGLYFTREEDAKKYREVRYRGAQYPVRILRISVID